MMHWKRRLYRYCWLPFYRVWALRYIRKNRVWKGFGLSLTIPEKVFHPGIFFSTPIFLRFLKAQALSGKKILDMGTGSGALAIFAAKQGATRVTAVDINPAAVQAAHQNASENGVSISVIESDLFQNIPDNAVFDLILVNPPYYPKKPANDTEKAFFAGENLEYFPAFFAGAARHTHPESCIWMILSEDCNWDFIQATASQTGFDAQVIYTQKHWGEAIFVGEFSRS